jgi:hypothetical protein
VSADEPEGPNRDDAGPDDRAPVTATDASEPGAEPAKPQSAVPEGGAGEAAGGPEDEAASPAESEDGDEAEAESESESESDAESAEPAGEGEGEPADPAPPSPQPGPRRVRPGELAALAVAVAVVAAVGVNAYVNVSAATRVREACWVEDQRLAAAIDAAAADRLPALDWMVALYRARRRYVQELCDGAASRLEWWRWNLTGEVHVDVSEHTQRDINKTLTRAASSCASEIRDLELAMSLEMERRDAGPELRGRARELVAGQVASCRELSAAVDEARPGFWPPLVADGPRDVPTKLEAMMPRSLHGGDEPPAVTP